jgi:hexosaminidase
MKQILLFFAIIFLGIQCSAPEKTSSLKILWRLNANGEEGHSATFFFVNNGKKPFERKDWTLHWSQAPHWVVSTEGPAKISNINGDFYRMDPEEEFTVLPGDTLRITYFSRGNMIKESDAPLGMYFVFNQGDQQLIEKVKNYELLPFVLPEQYTRSGGEMIPHPTAEYIFDRNEKIFAGATGNSYPFIPSPVDFQPIEEEFILKSGVIIGYDPAFENEANFFKEALQHAVGVTSQLSPKSGPEISILLSGDNSLGKEAYRIKVDKERVEISGSHGAGIFYGIHSVLSLIQNGKIQGCYIFDEPAFEYRGLQLDVGRNFQSKATIIKLLDVMAGYKLNKFLFYLTEDEGWRLEMKDFPELTEVGARRGHTLNDSLFLQPSYGSGPDPDDKNSYGNGHYSRADFIEIIQHAQKLHINVIPQFNLPGHARAAIKAMELRYHRLMAIGDEKGANEYRLIDPQDTSRYISAQGYFDNTVCVCQDQPLKFYTKIVEDVIEMYKEAGVELTMIHTGGDEVPATAWKGSPLCQEFLKDKPEIVSTRNLQGLFFGQLAELIQSKGLQTGAWEEAVMEFRDGGNWNPNHQFVGKEVYPYIWNNLWGQQDLGYKLANAGYPVILCNVNNFYFDLAYNKDPREPGLYWAGFVDTEDAFSMLPFNVFESTRRDEMGKPYIPEVDYVNMEQLKPEARKNIVGLQAQLWGETLKGEKMLEYYTLPKLFGFAQRAWQGTPSWAGKDDNTRISDYGQFLKTVSEKELVLLDQINGGYHYRIPPPGIKEEGGMIKMNSEYPTFLIRYTMDGSEPNSSSPIYKDPIQITQPMIITAATFNSKGRKGFTSKVEIK